MPQSETTEELRLIETLTSMCHAQLIGGSGAVTSKTFASNLRLFADRLDALRDRQPHQPKGSSDE